MNKLQQFYVMAINYERLKNNSFDLWLSLDDAFENEEIIALADNNCLRAIRKITGHPFSPTALWQLKKEKTFLMRQAESGDNRLNVCKVVKQIRELLFVPEFVSVTFPSNVKKKDYNKFNTNGFHLNGKRYVWLLCGAGHQRTNRAMYCTEEIYEELNKVFSCGINNDVSRGDK